MKADKIIIGKKNDMEMNNIEEGGHKRKKKGYQSTYDFQNLVLLYRTWTLPHLFLETNPIPKLAHQITKMTTVYEVVFFYKKNLLSEMYRRLLSNGQITPTPLIPLQPPFLKWYRPNKTYEYHAYIVKHNIDEYICSL